MTADGSTVHVARLRAAAHELLSLADELEHTNEHRQSKIDSAETFSPSALVALAAKMFACRELRRSNFKYDIFGEPAWDMLLYLYVRAGEGKREYKTAVTGASGVPHATALRYLSLLERGRLVSIERADGDRRVQLVSLTKEGLSDMTNFLSYAIK